jgi:hypothetical protein
MIADVVRHPERAHFFMPPWAGNEAEAELLSEYLQSVALPYPPGLPASVEAVSSASPVPATPAGH